MSRIVVLADDLSGAVEAAAQFSLRETRSEVLLDSTAASTADVVVIDTDSRALAPPGAADRVRRAAASRPSAVLVKKIDSLLRGNLPAELGELRSARPAMIICPALPALGRTTRNGRVLVDGVPLDETDAWRAEGAAPGSSIPAMLPALPTRCIPLDVVRGSGLGPALAAAIGTGLAPVCDAETDDDLDRIVEGAGQLGTTLLVGSAGLVAALARTLAYRPAATADADGDPAGGRQVHDVLVVVGSAAGGVAAQLTALAGAGAAVHLASPEALLDPAGRATLRAGLSGAEGGVTVLAIDPTATVRAQRSAELTVALADVAAERAERAEGLVLTGGATARAVLARTGVRALSPVLTVHHGAVVSRTSDGRLVATRPGSFGGPDSLISLVRALTGAGNHA